MDVNAHFNSQFVMIDFELLDTTEFMRFVGSSTFSVYLLLRRYVWRSRERMHSSGLHELYADGLLSCSVSVATLAEKSGLAERSIKEATSRLEDLGIVQSRATGREKIYVLGEWVDISQSKDASVRKEWFYLERVFTGRGAETCMAEVQPSPEAPCGAEPCPSGVQKSAPSNREDNIESVNAHGSCERKHPDHVRYLVEEILKVCGDDHSRPYYAKLAARIPDDRIFQSLSEIRQDPTVRNRGALFVSKLGTARSSRSTP